MNSTSLQTELSNLFEQRKFQSILERAQSDEISPANNPHASNIVAAALFQIGRFSDCLLWCEALSPSLSGNASFISMYGAVLRRVGRLEEAEQVPELPWKQIQIIHFYATISQTCSSTVKNSRKRN